MERLRRRSRARREEGFSLVEVVVALGLMAVVMLALLSTGIFAAKATVDARKNQQAADYANQAIESVRALAYADAALLSTQTSSDPNIVTVAGVKKYDAGSGLEDLAQSATGQVRPQSETVSTTNGTYTIRRYVTIPAGTTYTSTGVPRVRRMTVAVSWVTGTKTHTRRSSTLITDTRRGLPLPNFTFTYNGPVTVVSGVPTEVKNPGNDVSYGLVLNNLGARDAWTLSASTAGWAFYLDADQDGIWSEDLTDEPALTANSTGLIEPGSAPVYVVAHRVIGASESGTTTTVFTATSEAVTTVFKSVTTKLTVQSGAITAPVPSAAASPAAPTGTCSPSIAPTVSSTGTLPTATTQNQYKLTTVHLYNAGGYQDTTVSSSNSMGKDTSSLPARTCNWSTDLHTGFAGRHLAAATTIPSPDTALAQAARTAEWRFQPGSIAEDQYRGVAVLAFWLQCPTTSPTITATLLTLSGTTYTSQATATVSATGCSSTGFSRYSVSFPDRTFALSSLTQSLVLRLSSNAAVRLGYGATDMPASLTIGMK